MPERKEFREPEPGGTAPVSGAEAADLVLLEAENTREMVHGCPRAVPRDELLPRHAKALEAPLRASATSQGGKTGRL